MSATGEPADVQALKRVTLPAIDLDTDPDRLFVVDRESGQYLGHVTSVLWEAGKTLSAVYPKNIRVRRGGDRVRQAVPGR